MPAYLPGSTNAQNAANPSAGAFVIFDPLSGPKGSPLDKGKGTGALCTGIGFGNAPIIGIAKSDIPATMAAALKRQGFVDDYIPGTKQSATINTVNSTWMYIGGGKSGAAANGIAPTTPYTANVSICGAGKGVTRDGGAGPAFTGFPLKMVTAAAGVAVDAVVETGFTNRTGRALVANESCFGSNATQLGVAS